MPKHLFNKKKKDKLKSAFISAKKFKIPWEELKSFDKNAIESILFANPTKKPSRKERQLKELFKAVPLLKDYYEYLYEKVEVRRRSPRSIGPEIGYVDPKAVAKHMEYYGITSISREEAISETLKRKGIKPIRTPGKRSRKVLIEKGIGKRPIKEVDWGTEQERKKMSGLLQNLEKKYGKGSKYKDKRKKRKRGEII